METPIDLSRREFLNRIAGAGAAMGAAWPVTAAAATSLPTDSEGNVIAGFATNETASEAAEAWQPFSDRRIRVGIAGHGFCQFGALFGFQDHPNVEVVAVTDLIPENRAALAKACRCSRTYPSFEEMTTNDSIEAVFIATDAPSHGRLAILALERGKHVASAVPAVWGSLEEADQLFNLVKRTGLKYMMFETSYFHKDLHAWHQRYRAGHLGEIIYSEGEYFHYFPTPLPAYNPKTNSIDTDGWRKGLPPQWYPTHSDAYHIGVTGGSFTEVSCLGMPSIVPHLQPENNVYGNPFGSEVALFRTSEGGMSRMAVTWDIPIAGGERGRVYGQKYETGPVEVTRPPLPPGVDAGMHGGSHGYLMSDFVDAILRDRTPRVDVAQALNMTVAGIVAHQSALRDGEWMKIPQYEL